MWYACPYMQIQIDPEFKALIPPLTPEQYAGLKASLEEYGGAREPLVVWNGTLLDGHNRHEICSAGNLSYTIRDAPETINSREDAIDWIIRNQKGRRNLSSTQLALLLLKSDMRSSRAKMAQFAGMSEGKFQAIELVSKSGYASILKALEDDNITANGASEAVKVLNRTRPELRPAILERFEADSKKNLKKIVGEIKLSAKRALAEELHANPIVTPDGRYQVIVSDPPWKYDTRAEDTSHRGKNQYPDMTVEEICALPVPTLSQDNCVLFLWTTNAFMRQAYQCLDAWGFREKTILTWDKERMGLGDWLRNQTEHCILAVKGRPVVSLTNQTTILRVPRREHSRKPEEFYTMVEALCPGSKLEMFSRTNREGWSTWGAETGSFDPSLVN